MRRKDLSNFYGTKRTFFVTDKGIASTNLTQVEKYTMNEITEVHAPVWQLCDSRHDNEIANMGGIFPKCLMNPLDVDGLTESLVQSFSNMDELSTMFCVVTGMSTALVALINFCSIKNIRLILMHYDIVHDCYQCQFVHNKYLDELYEIRRKHDNHNGLRALR